MMKKKIYMIKPEIVLKNQVKKINLFIQGIKKIPNPIILDGVSFSLEDLQRLAADMQTNATYVEFDIFNLRKENRELKRGYGK
jgi:hypothetical protein